MVSEASATNYDAINYVVIGLMLLGWTYFDAKVFKSKTKTHSLEAPLAELNIYFQGLPSSDESHTMCRLTLLVPSGVSSHPEAIFHQSGLATWTPPARRDTPLKIPRRSEPGFV